VAAQIPYNANSSDVSAQVLQLKDKKPDAVIFVSYTSDTILYMKTLKSLDYLPPVHHRRRRRLLRPLLHPDGR